MSWRKKIGWRGPLRDPVSVMTEAAIESAGGFDGCAWDGAPPKASSAASPPAPTPPTTKANVRIIDLTLRERRWRILVKSFTYSCAHTTARGRVGAEVYSAHPITQPDRAIIPTLLLGIVRPT